MPITNDSTLLHQTRRACTVFLPSLRLCAQCSSLRASSKTRSAPILSLQRPSANSSKILGGGWQPCRRGRRAELAAQQLVNVPTLFRRGGLSNGGLPHPQASSIIQPRPKDSFFHRSTFIFQDCQRTTTLRSTSRTTLRRSTHPFDTDTALAQLTPIA